MVPACEGLEDFRISSKMATVQDYNSSTLRLSLFPDLHSGLILPISKSGRGL
jgi:hypothetical protein